MPPIPWTFAFQVGNGSSDSVGRGECIFRHPAARDRNYGRDNCNPWCHHCGNNELDGNFVAHFQNIGWGANYQGESCIVLRLRHAGALGRGGQNKNHHPPCRSARFPQAGNALAGWLGGSGHHTLQRLQVYLSFATPFVHPIAPRASRCLDLILHAVAFPLDDHGFSVVQEPVQHGAGEGAVVVEDFGPVFIGLVGGQQDGALLVTLADDLEEQIRAGFVDGQIAQFVHGQDSGLEVTFKFGFEPADGLRGGERVDDVHGGGEENRVPAQAGFVGQGAG